MFYNIKQFSELLSVTKQTLRNWDKEGKLVPIKLESGHRRYTNEHLKQFNSQIKNTNRLNIIYTCDIDKTLLNNQIIKCKDFCISKGLNINDVISDNLSVLNYNRIGLNKLIRLIVENKIDNIIIYSKNKLVELGFEMFEQLALINNFNIIIIDNSNI